MPNIHEDRYEHVVSTSGERVTIDVPGYLDRKRLTHLKLNTVWYGDWETPQTEREKGFELRMMEGADDRVGRHLANFYRHKLSDETIVEVSEGVAEFLEVEVHLPGGLKESLHRINPEEPLYDSEGFRHSFVAVSHSEIVTKYASVFVVWDRRTGQCLKAGAEDMRLSNAPLPEGERRKRMEDASTTWMEFVAQSRRGVEGHLEGESEVEPSA